MLALEKSTFKINLLTPTFSQYLIFWSTQTFLYSLGHLFVQSYLFIWKTQFIFVHYIFVQTLCFHLLVSHMHGFYSYFAAHFSCPADRQRLIGFQSNMAIAHATLWSVTKRSVCLLRLSFQPYLLSAYEQLYTVDTPIRELFSLWASGYHTGYSQHFTRNIEVEKLHDIRNNKLSVWKPLPFRSFLLQVGTNHRIKQLFC